MKCSVDITAAYGVLKRLSNVVTGFRKPDHLEHHTNLDLIVNYAFIYETEHDVSYCIVYIWIM